MTARRRADGEAQAGRMTRRRWADDGAEAGPMTGPAQDVAAMVAGRPALLRDACRRALAYLDGLAERRVAPDAEAVAALDRLDFPLPGPGLADGEVLRMLDELGSPATVASAGPRYFGFVTGG